MSIAVIRPMPLLPALSEAQNVSTSLPSGLMTPMPVITTLRSLFIKVTGEEYGLTRKEQRQLACHWSLVTGHSSCSHADALHGLEEFAFGLDGGRDDNFSLLKLGDISRADVAHAGRDRADQILTAVINLGRSEKDLS